MARETSNNHTPTVGPLLAAGNLKGLPSAVNDAAKADRIRQAYGGYNKELHWDLTYFLRSIGLKDSGMKN